MKKLFGGLLAFSMMCCYILPINALTNYKLEDYIETYHESGAGKGTITPDKDNHNILNLKGSDGSSDFAGMVNGPYIKTNSKLSDKGGIREVVYVDHSTLKPTDVLQIEYRLYKDGKYANEVDTYAQVGYDGKINLSLTAGNFSVELPDNGIYKYEFKAYSENDVVFVEFNVYDSNDKQIGATGKLNLNEVFNWKNVNVTGKDNVTLDAIWFANIKAEGGINVYNLADSEVVIEGNVDVVDSNKVQEVLKEALQNSSFANDSKFEDVNVDIEMNQEKVNNEEVTKIKDSINDVLKNGKVSNFFDLSIVVKNEAGNEIGKLHQLKESLELKVSIPDELKKVQAGYQRKYYVVRYHDGKIDTLDTNITSDGKSLLFKTDKFSTYAIAYVDTKVEEVPNTLDNITTYLFFGTISILTVSGIIIYIKKKKLFS